MASTPDPETRTKPGFRRYIPIAVIGAVLVLVFAMGWQNYFTLEALQENREQLNAIVLDNQAIAIVAFIAVYATLIVVVPPSGTILTLMSGFLFGTLIGGFATVLGATTGATGIFLATRTAFGDTLRRRAGPSIQKMEAGFQKNAVSYMLFLRLVPVFPFFVVNIVPAFLGVPLRIFVATTAVGIVPGTFIYASLGAGLSGIIGEEEINLGLIFEPQYLLPLLGLAALALVPIIVNRVRSGKESDEG